MLTNLEHLPAGILDAAASALHTVLPGPTLIHLPGRHREPLFVSVLLHGNEDTGLVAVQRVLRQFAPHELPRALSLFIGNVAAAREGVRRLDGQPDYNRVWPGADSAGTPEHAMMRAIVEDLRARRVFASIDLHNNTGLNPHYACLTRLEQPSLHLARLFSRIAVLFRRPVGTQTAAFAPLCPAVTVECGKAGTGAAEAHAVEFIEACLHLDHFPAHPVPRGDIDLFHTVAVVQMPERVSFGFGAGGVDVRFDADIDRLNFRELRPGKVLAQVAAHCREPVHAWNEDGQQVAAEFFEVSAGELRMRRKLMPAMLTRDVRVIRQDCLCYLMERIAMPAA